MGHDAPPTAGVADRPFTNPWPTLYAGLAAGVLAFAWLQFAPQTLVLGRILLLALGLLAVGAAIAIRPASSAVLGVGALAGLVLSRGQDPAWDTARLMTTVLTAVAAAAALVMLLPRVWRRVAFSVLIVFHFGSILTAVTSVPPQPWLSLMAWTYVYRPYLEFMYLNNAYHFYSPDPGPATLAWFRLQYEDGSARWIKIPNRQDYPDPLCVNYQRRLALTESINQLAPPPPILPAEFGARRLEVGRELGIPLHPNGTLPSQYREPLKFSKRMLESFVRHVAWSYPHLEDPKKKVIAVKVYRVVHTIPTPRELIERNGRIDDETQYQAYYQGEFDPDGNLVHPEDPLLYWLIPILRVPKVSAWPTGPDSPGLRSNRLEDYEIKDYVAIHAGDKLPE
jgi:hypothetical protein